MGNSPHQVPIASSKILRLYITVEVLVVTLESPSPVDDGDETCGGLGCRRRCAMKAT